MGMRQPHAPPLRIGIVAWQALPAIVPLREVTSAGAVTGANKISLQGTQTPPARHAQQADYLGRTFGGLETAMWTLAKALAMDPELDVHCFVKTAQRLNGSEAWPQRVAGVTLHVDVDRFWNIRHQVGQCVDIPARKIKRFAWSLLWQLPLLFATRPFRKRDPVACQPDDRLRGHSIDAWLTFGVNEASSRVVATALTAGRPSFLFVQSNSGVDPRLADSEEFFNECGESSIPRRFALKHADRVVCQSRWQCDRLAQAMNLQAALARNPIEPSEWLREPTSSEHPYVLWIGRYDDFHKRPLMMLELASLLPDLHIKMIVNALDPEIEEQVRRRCPANVSLIDQIPFAEMPEVFANAKLFVSTGNPDLEGFPNVLLQAAASHTPIVSLHDYDQFLERSGAGVGCDGSLELVRDQILAYWDDASKVEWPRVDAYLNRYHSSVQIANDVKMLIVQRYQLNSIRQVPTTP